jgi:hypothetical protein
VDERLPRFIIPQFCFYEKGFLQKKRIFLCMLLKWYRIFRIGQYRLKAARGTCMKMANLHRAAMKEGKKQQKCSLKRCVLQKNRISAKGGLARKGQSGV